MQFMSRDVGVLRVSIDCAPAARHDRKQHLLCEIKLIRLFVCFFIFNKKKMAPRKSLNVYAVVYF